MSSTRRHDLAERATMNDDSATFKKAFQTVGRPAVTERDFHEEYMQDPPRVSCLSLYPLPGLGLMVTLYTTERPA